MTVYSWQVHWGGAIFVITAADYEPDEGGVSFLSAPLEDESADTIAYFSNPVAILRGEPVQSTTLERAP
jgi:hypothetical protein